MRFPNPREVRNALYQREISSVRLKKDEELLLVCINILRQSEAPISSSSLGYMLRKNPEWKKLVPSSGLTRFLRDEKRKEYFQLAHEVRDKEKITWVQYTGVPLPQSIEFKFKELNLHGPDTVTEIPEYILTQSMQELVKKLECSPEEKEKWENLRLRIEKTARKKWPHCKINGHLFGSTANTLGATGCDIDICLEVLECERPVRLERIRGILAELNKELRDERFENCQAVLHAKVPHLKFHAPGLGWGDVSVNSMDSLQKTRLLKSYCDLDDRIRTAILVMKEWTHQRRMNQASLDGGTLNSFCYTLMFIAFMQIKHGLPNLQRLCCLPRSSAELTQAEDRCIACKSPIPSSQTWFFSDIHSLKSVYKPSGDSIARIFLDFLQFYAFELDYLEQVVSIRVGALISRQQKGWTIDTTSTNPNSVKLLCVEDPFDLSRNVATSAKPWVVEGIRWEFERAAREFCTRGLSGLLERYSPPRDITMFVDQYPWSLNNDETPLRGFNGSRKSNN